MITRKIYISANFTSHFQKHLIIFSRIIAEAATPKLTYNPKVGTDYVIIKGLDYK
jgi:hypothetical protein